jgi:hypothetical protein
LTNVKTNLYNAVGEMIAWWNNQAGGASVGQLVYSLFTISIGADTIAGPSQFSQPTQQWAFDSADWQ